MVCQLRAGNSINFWLTNGCSWERVKVSETENVSTQGGLEPPTFEFMPDALLIELPGPNIYYHLLFWNTGSGGMDIFGCKV